MRKSAGLFLALGALFLTGGVARAEVIWTGPTITFTKADFADWTLAQNQDRLTADVWITRADTQGIFNIEQEPAGFASFVSPVGTEWAYGSAANWPSLSFQDWEDWTGKNPPSTVGKPAVLHLVSADIYLDIMFTSWSGAGSGGGFSYERSTPVPEPGTLVVLAAGGIALLAYGWRRRRLAA